MKIVLLIYFAGSTVCAQYFQFDRIKAHDVAGIERAFNSTEEQVTYKVGVAETYFPGAKSSNLAQPLMFIRVDSNWVPYPEINYFFSEPDSIVRLIDYTWDARKITSLVDVFNTPKQAPQISGYNAKYFSLRSMIVEFLGQPNEGDDSLHTVKDGDREWQERLAKWKTERCTVELNMTWSPPGKRFGTYRIRVKVY